jgi:hypothetical protein
VPVIVCELVGVGSEHGYLKFRPSVGVQAVVSVAVVLFGGSLLAAVWAAVFWQCVSAGLFVMMVWERGSIHIWSPTHV